MLKKFLEPRSDEEKFLRPSRGIWGQALPENFEKIVFRIG